MNRLFKLIGSYWHFALVFKLISPGNWQRTDEIIDISQDSIFLQLTEPMLNENNEWIAFYLTKEHIVGVSVRFLELLSPNED